MFEDENGEPDNPVNLMTENARAGTFCQSAVFALLVSGVHRKRSAPDDGSFDSTAISYRQARVVAAPFAG